VLSPAVRERSALQQAQGASQPVHRWPGAPAQELASGFDAHLARILRINQRGAAKKAAAS
jgi:chromosome partitioning protein